MDGPKLGIDPRWGKASVISSVISNAREALGGDDGTDQALDRGPIFSAGPAKGEVMTHQR